MNSLRVDSCKHAWRFLPRPVYTFTIYGSLATAENAECTVCGARTWAHGRMPYDAPTTEGATRAE